MKVVIHLLEKILNGLGNLCSLLMILMILNVFYDVVMRYLFNDVSIAMQELEWHLFAAMFMLGVGYTLKEDGHVRVDIFYEKMSERYKALINIGGSVLFALPFTLLILYFSWGYTMDAYSMGEGSADPGGLPYRWIVRSVIPVSSIFLLLSILYVTLKNIQIITVVKSAENRK
ncbi:MAG: TRAP-type mannitol/chloroaromatic compound transport system permease small subunit [Glaciecola sp.]|jgi:TRAP-type mannitol/chloroaromatic compound transport system permease small subunit